MMHFPMKCQGVIHDYKVPRCRQCVPRPNLFPRQHRLLTISPSPLQLNIYKNLNLWHFSLPHFPKTEYPSHPSQWQKPCEQSVSNPAFLPPKPNHSLTTKQTSKTPPAQPAPSSSPPQFPNRHLLPLPPSSKSKLSDLTAWISSNVKESTLSHHKQVRY